MPPNARLKEHDSFVIFWFPKNYKRELERLARSPSQGGPPCSTSALARWVIAERLKKKSAIDPADVPAGWQGIRKDVKLIFRLPADVKRELKRRAAAEGATMSELGSMILIGHVKLYGNPGGNKAAMKVPGRSRISTARPQVRMERFSHDRED